MEPIGWLDVLMYHITQLWLIVIYQHTKSANWFHNNLLHLNQPLPNSNSNEACCFVTGKWTLCVITLNTLAHWIKYAWCSARHIITKWWWCAKYGCRGTVRWHRSNSDKHGTGQPMWKQQLLYEPINTTDSTKNCIWSANTNFMICCMWHMFESAVAVCDICLRQQTKNIGEWHQTYKQQLLYLK